MDQRLSRRGITGTDEGKLAHRSENFRGFHLLTVRKFLAFSAVVSLCAGSCSPQLPLPGRLQLSNPNFGLINVEAVITANPDCAARDDGYVSTLEFTMPNNATKFIEAPPGADVCWRSDRNTG